MSCANATTPNPISGYDARRRTGINIHQSAFGHNQSFAQQAALVDALGFGWVRLGIHSGNSAAQVVANVTEYQNRGIRYMLLPVTTGENAVTQTAMASLDPTMCVGLEGRNEISNDASGWTNAQAQHANLAAMRAAVSGWATVPIVSSSFSTANITVNGAFGALSPAVAMNNWHQYDRPGGISDADFQIGLARDKVGPFVNNNRVLLGEFGWTSGAAPSGTDIEIDDRAAGILASRAVLYALSFPNIVYNSIYELMDEPTLGGAEAHFGQVLSDGTVKSSYTQLARLMALIGETTASTPTNLSYTSSGGTSWDSRGVSSALFQKSNGRYYLCLWDAVNVVTNPSGGGATFPSGDLSIPAGVSATFTFGRTFTTINRYAPYLGAGIQAATTNTNTWTGNAQAYVQVLELVP